MDFGYLWRLAMEKKLVSISAKRQITIPQKFYMQLGFDTDAECMVRGNELVIRPVRKHTGGDFAEEILADLLAQGYSGSQLLEEFKKMQQAVRPAVQELLNQAEQVAVGSIPSEQYDDIFPKGE
ncbi:MAG: AbrB/MazE/SpoVT family DNA-binding domain-containing protein [Clostridia bacterium]|nr:AbrB/MazE/SpoVT family DNA-binding domain-containing protein [Clostridia bacterium]